MDVVAKNEGRVTRGANDKQLRALRFMTDDRAEIGATRMNAFWNVHFSVCVIIVVRVFVEGLTRASLYYRKRVQGPSVYRASV